MWIHMKIIFNQLSNISSLGYVYTDKWKGVSSHSKNKTKN